MGEHSNRIGGSSLYRRANCPGSYREEERVGREDTSSEYADEGSLLHDVMDICVRSSARPIDQWAWWQQENRIPTFNNAELNAENVKLAQSAWEMYDGLRSEVRGFVKASEVRVSLEAIGPNLFGTSDLAWFGEYRGRPTLGIVDWKFGAGVGVPARGSMQLGFYMLGLMLDPYFAEYAEQAEQFALAIGQPPKSDDLDMWVTTREWLKMLETVVRTTNDAIDNPKAPLRVGDWCRWCSAFTSCSAIQELGEDALSLAPQKMTAVEYAYWLPRLDQLKAFANEVERLAKSEVDFGAAIAGWKVVEAIGNRKLVDPDVTMDWLRKKAKLRVSDIEEKKIKSPAQIEKTIKAAHKKDRAKALIEELNERFVHRPITGTKLVPNSDPRPAAASAGDVLGRALGGIDVDFQG